MRQLVFVTLLLFGGLARLPLVAQVTDQPNDPYGTMARLQADMHAEQNKAQPGPLQQLLPATSFFTRYPLKQRLLDLKFINDQIRQQAWLVESATAIARYLQAQGVLHQAMVTRLDSSELPDFDARLQYRYLATETMWLIYAEDLTDQAFQHACLQTFIKAVLQHQYHELEPHKIRASLLSVLIQFAHAAFDQGDDAFRVWSLMQLSRFESQLCNILTPPVDPAGIAALLALTEKLAALPKPSDAQKKTLRDFIEVARWESYMMLAANQTQRTIILRAALALNPSRAIEIFIGGDTLIAILDNPHSSPALLDVALRYLENARHILPAHLHTWERIMKAALLSKFISRAIIDPSRQPLCARALQLLLPYQRYVAGKIKMFSIAPQLSFEELTRLATDQTLNLAITQSDASLWPIALEAELYLYQHGATEPIMRDQIMAAWAARLDKGVWIKTLLPSPEDNIENVIFSVLHALEQSQNPAHQAVVRRFMAQLTTAPQYPQWHEKILPHLNIGAASTNLSSLNTIIRAYVEHVSLAIYATHIMYDDPTPVLENLVIKEEKVLGSAITLGMAQPVSEILVPLLRQLYAQPFFQQLPASMTPMIAQVLAYRLILHGMQHSLEQSLEQRSDLLQNPRSNVKIQTIHSHLEVMLHFCQRWLLEIADADSSRFSAMITQFEELLEQVQACLHTDPSSKLAPPQPIFTHLQNGSNLVAKLNAMFSSNTYFLPNPTTATPPIAAATLTPLYNDNRQSFYYDQLLNALARPNVEAYTATMRTIENSARPLLLGSGH